MTKYTVEFYSNGEKTCTLFDVECEEFARYINVYWPKKDKIKLSSHGIIAHSSYTLEQHLEKVSDGYKCTDTEGFDLVFYN